MSWHPIETAPDGEKIIIRDRDRRDEIFVVAKRSGESLVVCWDNSSFPVIHGYEWSVLPK